MDGDGGSQAGSLRSGAEARPEVLMDDRRRARPSPSIATWRARRDDATEGSLHQPLLRRHGGGAGRHDRRGSRLSLRTGRAATGRDFTPPPRATPVGSRPRLWKRARPLRACSANNRKRDSSASTCPSAWFAKDGWDSVPGEMHSRARRGRCRATAGALRELRSRRVQRGRRARAGLARRRDGIGARAPARRTARASRRRTGAGSMASTRRRSAASRVGSGPQPRPIPTTSGRPPPRSRRHSRPPG